MVSPKRKFQTGSDNNTALTAVKNDHGAASGPLQFRDSTEYINFTLQKILKESKSSQSVANPQLSTMSHGLQITNGRATVSRTLVLASEFGGNKEVCKV
ncbi:hypothetical protein FRC10_006984 [Ceratobasidium sp. 414]|nr:hypothetical protein FRC10_006984 [Ceratobasidium sp. 414]